MKRETITRMLNCLDERYIREAAIYDPGAIRETPERTVHMKKKRLIGIALAAALILALGITAYAVAGSGFVVSHQMNDTGIYSDLSELPQVEKTVGYPVTALESFSNGYSFTRMTVRGEAVCSENNEIEREFYGVHLDYAKPGSPDRYLDLDPVPDTAETTPGEQRTIGGVSVRLILDRYKFVPEDYEKTPEDLAKEAAGHYYITFGADGISESSCAFVSFALDGVEYMLSDMNADADALEELAQMAGELIAAAEN